MFFVILSLVSSVFRFDRAQNRSLKTVCDKFKTENFGMFQTLYHQSTTTYFKSPSGCTLPSYDRDTDNKRALSTLNYIRWLVGFQKQVTLDPSKYAEQDACAVCSLKNRDLDHHPTSNKQCYSQAAYNGCSNSNLAYTSNPSTSADFVINWVDDERVSELGHRIWSIHPGMKTTAFGGASSGYSYGAMRTIDVVKYNDVEDIPFIAFPSPGYIHYEYAFKYWSFQKYGLSNPQVEVKIDGRSVQVQSSILNAWYYPLCVKFTFDGATNINGKTVSVKITDGSNVYTYEVIGRDCNSEITEPSTGGNNPSTGGSNPSTGGNNPSSGGNNPSTGGNNPSTGGSNPSTGGSEQGTGTGNNESQGKGLAKGQIAGIVAVVLVVVIAAVIAGVIFWQKHKKAEETSANEAAEK